MAVLLKMCAPGSQVSVTTNSLLLAGSPSSMRMSSMWAGLTIGATAGFILAYQNSAGELHRQVYCSKVAAWTSLPAMSPQRNLSPMCQVAACTRRCHKASLEVCFRPAVNTDTQNSATGRLMGLKPNDKEVETGLARK